MPTWRVATSTSLPPTAGSSSSATSATLWSGKHECLHDSPLLAVANRLQSIALVNQGGLEMKAARYHGRLDIRIEDVPTPVPADDELLVAVSAVGICGTDAAEFAHGPTMFPIDPPTPSPVIAGR